MHADGRFKSAMVESANVALFVMEAHQAMDGADCHQRRFYRRLHVRDGGARNRDLDEGAKQRPQLAKIIASGWHNRPIYFLPPRSHAATTRSRPRYCECQN